MSRVIESSWVNVYLTYSSAKHSTPRQDCVDSAPKDTISPQKEIVSCSLVLAQQHYLRELAHLAELIILLFLVFVQLRLHTASSTTLTIQPIASNVSEAIILTRSTAARSCLLSAKTLTD